MNKTKLFFGACVASVLSTMNATAQLSIGTEVRPRIEVRSGYKDLLKPGTEPYGIGTQRTRLNIGFKSEKIKTYVSFQNIAVWGEQVRSKRTATSSDSSLTSMFEGWAELSLCKYSALRLGRQTIAIEDERLLSGGNWGQAGQFLDGLLYHFDNDSIAKIRVFASYNNQKDTTVASLMPNNKTSAKFKTFNFVEVKKEVSSNLNFTLLGLFTGYLKDKTTDKYLIKNTYGGYVTLKNDELAITGSGFYQNGQNSAAKRTRAYMASLQVKYTKKPYEVTLGFDLLSGDDMNKTKGKVDADYAKFDHKFDVLLGTTRPFQGTMELVNTKTSDAGILNSYLKVKSQMTEKCAVGFNYFFFRTQNNAGISSNGTYTELNKYLGQEVDALVSYKISSEANFELGYSYVFAADALKQLKKAANAYDNQNWLWVQLTFKPKLFEGALKN